MPADVLLIVNKKARTGRADLQAGIDLWSQFGWQILEEHPERPERIPELIRQLGPRSSRIVIGSGDGTLNHAAEALLVTGRPLGIIPLGTANDLARTLLIPPDPFEACRIVRNGHLHKIDLGAANDRLFFNVANIGLGAKVTRNLSGELKNRWGALAYLKGFYEAFTSHSPFRTQLNCDGDAETFRSIQIAVGNVRHYGGGMTIAEEARIDDHVLHLFSLTPQSLFEMAGLAPALRRGRIEDQERLLCRTGATMEIRTSRPLPVATDGELTTRTPVCFKVIPRALAVYVPEIYLESKHADVA